MCIRRVLIYQHLGGFCSSWAGREGQDQPRRAAWRSAGAVAPAAGEGIPEAGCAGSTARARGWVWRVDLWAGEIQPVGGCRSSWAVREGPDQPRRAVWRSAGAVAPVRRIPVARLYRKHSECRRAGGGCGPFVCDGCDLRAEGRPKPRGAARGSGSCRGSRPWWGRRGENQRRGCTGSTAHACGCGRCRRYTGDTDRRPLPTLLGSLRLSP